MSMNIFLNIGGQHLHIHSVHLAKLVRTLSKNSNVLEIGVGIGRSTRIILMNLDGTLYSIDKEDRSKLFEEYNNWRFIRGYDLNILKDLQLDISMVFIDLDRDSDSKHYLELFRLLKKNLIEKGFIVVYNTCVFKNSIIPAIEEFCREYPEYKFLNLESRHGMGILSKNIEHIKEILS